MPTKKAPKKQFHFLTPYFSPDRQVEELICGFITRTKATLDIAIYGFTLSSIAKEIQDAVSRGVKVRIVADREQASGKYAQAIVLKKWIESNPAVKGSLEVRIDHEKGKFHNKFMISDAKAVIMGSANYTEGGVAINRENTIIIRIGKVVRAFQANYEEIWTANAPK